MLIHIKCGMEHRDKLIGKPSPKGGWDTHKSKLINTQNHGTKNDLCTVILTGDSEFPCEHVAFLETIQ